MLAPDIGSIVVGFAERIAGRDEGAAAGAERIAALADVHDKSRIGVDDEIGGQVGCDGGGGNGGGHGRHHTVVAIPA
ncbi:hypothetical protein LP419_06630 [Massilia sp. H-1]|nr:hypothetical protein LP419_06630 [Massilia sp. H-1]